MPTVAKQDGRKRRGEMTRAIAFQKVVLAVYVFSRDDDPICLATNTYIGRECGMSPAVVGQGIAEMERRKLIRIFDWRDGLCCRLMVLLDTPEGRKFARQMRREYGPRRK